MANWYLCEYEQKYKSINAMVSRNRQTAEGRRPTNVGAKRANPRTVARDLEEMMKERADALQQDGTRHKTSARKLKLSYKMVFKVDNDPKYASQTVIGHHKASSSIQKIFWKN